MRILAILLGWCLCVSGALIPLTYLQRAHYRLWRSVPRPYLVSQAALALYATAVGLVWHFCIPDPAYAPLSVTVCYVPQAVICLLFLSVRPRFSARFLRLWATVSLVFALGAVLTICLPPCTVFYGTWAAISYPIVQLSAALLGPFERRNNARFLARQSGRLRAMGMVVIGITGSAGKTSVKQLLACALGDKCYATQGNYNTPMGLALSVRDMPAGMRYFVAEMGAAQVGDMRDLLAFVSPAIGVLTCVLPQHTARFGGVEDIRREKALLLAASSWSVSADPLAQADCMIGAGHDYWVGNVRLEQQCTHFEIHSPLGVYPVTLPLCGRQCAHNAVLAWAVASHLGIDPATITARWQHIPRDPHRLCPTRNARGVTVIDDSYNCNLQGARYALEYLALYVGRKVVAVSGIDESDPGLHLNRQLAAAIDEVADVVVIVGDRYRDELLDGLRHCRVYTVPNTASTVPLYGRLLRAGDALLIMADYPV